MRHAITKDLTGLTFGDWLVLAHAGTRSRKQYWTCRCKCGHEKDVESYTLTAGRSKSCRPCSAAAVAAETHVTHGQTGTKLYRTWQAIKTRCYNPKAKSCYKYHGALGVRVHDAWLNDFEAFAAYMGEPPTPRHTIDRKDPWGHYEPGNVRWATPAEQMANTRRANGRGEGLISPPAFSA